MHPCFVFHILVLKMEGTHNQNVRYSGGRYRLGVKSPRCGRGAAGSIPATDIYFLSCYPNWLCYRSSMPSFLPILEDAQDHDLVAALSRIAPIVLPSTLLQTVSLPQPSTYYILVGQDSLVTREEVVSWLDNGAEKVILPLVCAKELIGVIPANRLLLLLDVGNFSAVSDGVRNGVSGVLLKTPAIDLDLISSVSRFFGSPIHVHAGLSSPPSNSIIRELLNIGAMVVLPTSQLSLTASTGRQINIADAFISPLVSDRADGLFPTIVTGSDGCCLGLVYSSAESIKESITTGKGVYQSRKHGLWRKGETSGSTQVVVGIRIDCDSDCLEFTVIQHGAGFCHLNRRSCFGETGGISALERTLQSRLTSAPEGSYTKRLFNDPELLQSKIMEEADELCQAKTKDEVAFEAADLLYFTLTRCIAAGVSLADIERSLDQKAKKISRRPGNSKMQWSSNPLTIPPPALTKPTDVDTTIRMCTTDLATVTSEERALLLRRPVLKSDEMIAKVKPIVDDIRIRGDSALIELTAKFDKAKLLSTVISPPFPPESMRLESDVRDAIDKAYNNITKFHQAQAETSSLVVETMPGVVCSRFVRPIARVGLYVPGGTAILPSTALMLGVPAQVAGCKEIVLATPPRSDGTISPEVMYVAHLVGASAIVTAGGAQAVAALAYGTETVPKVDKIFGPGNQWVTAAKMMVQNDTDALVSIDMPAGPSEVLVSAIF